MIAGRGQFYIFWSDPMSIESHKKLSRYPRMIFYKQTKDLSHIYFFLTLWGIVNLAYFHYL